MKLEVLEPSTTREAIEDDRGGVFTWVPDEPILEFNLVYLGEGKTRGNHLHTEFTEYFLVVEGSGVMVTRDPDDDGERFIHMSRGSCTRAPRGVPHAFRAFTPVTAVAMITKPWADCEEATRRIQLIDTSRS